MITFLVKKGFHSTVHSWLISEWAPKCKDHICILPYRYISRLTQKPQHLIVFTDHERLSNVEKRALARIWHNLRISHPELELFNNPLHVLVRGELIKKLFNLGLGDYEAWSCKADLDTLKYPVFIRSISEHTGNLTELLYRPEQVKEAIDRLAFPSDRFKKDDLLIVQYYETRDDQNMYWKYSSYIIGNEIIPRSKRMSANWMVKASHGIYDMERATANMEYVRNNPHKEQLELVRQITNIQYGRFDYSMKNGKPQVWEINTNPMIEITPEKKEKALSRRSKDSLASHLASKDIFFESFNQRFEQILNRQPVRIHPDDLQYVRRLQLAVLNAQAGYHGRKTFMSVRSMIAKLLKTRVDSPNQIKKTK
jgi:hypothetical protein